MRPRLSERVIRNAERADADFVASGQHNLIVDVRPVIAQSNGRLLVGVVDQVQRIGVARNRVGSGEPKRNITRRPRLRPQLDAVCRFVERKPPDEQPLPSNQPLEQAQHRRVCNVDHGLIPVGQVVARAQLERHDHGLVDVRRARRVIVEQVLDDVLCRPVAIGRRVGAKQVRRTRPPGCISVLQPAAVEIDAGSDLDLLLRSVSLKDRARDALPRQERLETVRRKRLRAAFEGLDRLGPGTVENDAVKLLRLKLDKPAPGASRPGARVVRVELQCGFVGRGPFALEHDSNVGQIADCLAVDVFEVPLRVAAHPAVVPAQNGRRHCRRTGPSCLGAHQPRDLSPVVGPRRASVHGGRADFRHTTGPKLHYRRIRHCCIVRASACANTLRTESPKKTAFFTVFARTHAPREHTQRTRHKLPTDCLQIANRISVPNRATIRNFRTV